MPKNRRNTKRPEGYFVTGGTGFIGRHLIKRLLERPGGKIFVLVRKRSLPRFQERLARWDAEPGRIVPVIGDLRALRLGLRPKQFAALRGQVRHFFHVGGLYDMTASDEALEQVNLAGTRHTVEAAERMSAGCFHHVSSVAAAGRYPGVFREDMFEEATNLDDPYLRTKHASEGVVRTECSVPWRIYRPSIVVGHSETGEMDKVDGPYYFFRLIQMLGAALPTWLPLIGIDVGPLNIVPVDFVARAMDHLAHAGGLDGRTFHLVDPNPKSAVETMNVFARVARAPEFATYLDATSADWIPDLVRRGGAALPMRVVAAVLASRFGIPQRLVLLGGLPTRFDCSATTKALAGTGIEVPPLEDYAERLWKFWETNLDCDFRHRPSLTRAVRGKRVLVTGASAGIGRAAALKLGAAGATVLLVARNAERLEAAKSAIEKAGGGAWSYPVDLSNVEACDLLTKRVLDEHGGVDVLINNAGHSIRRSLELEYQRFHDYERTMQLNYFGALRLILAFVPGMRERKNGHIVNVSTMGVQTGGPRFSAYLASKSALDAFSRSAASELLADGVSITTVYMPLVKTEMSAPTPLWESYFELTPAQAADLICDAVVRRPKRVSNPLGLFSELAYLAAPRAVDAWMSVVYRLSPDTAAARGEKSSAADEGSGLWGALGRLFAGLRLRAS